MKKFKNNTKILIFSFVGLVVLGLVLLLLLMTKPQEQDDPSESDAAFEETQNLELISDAVENIEIVDVLNQTSSYTIEAVPSGEETAYTIKSLGNAKLNNSVFTKNLEYLAKVTAVDMVEESADLDKYGLKSPNVVIRVVFKNRPAYVLNIGNEAPIDNVTYVSIDNNDTVYTLATNKTAPFLLSEYSYISTALTEVYNSGDGIEVEKLSISNRGQPELVIEARDSDEKTENAALAKHIITAPYKLMISGEKSEKYIYGLFGLNALKVAGLNDELSKYGLSEPLCTVAMKYGGTDYKLDIGDPVNTKDSAVPAYYATINTANGAVYIIEADLLPWIDVTASDLMSNLFMLPYIYDLNEYIIEAGEQKIVVQIKGDAESAEFSTNGQELDSQRARNLYQYMLGAFADSIYTDEPQLPLIARFTYKYKDADVTDDIVEFYESNDRKVIIKVNGNPMFKCREAYTARLMQNIEAFLNGDEIVLSW